MVRHPDMDMRCGLRTAYGATTGVQGTVPLYEEERRTT